MKPILVAVIALCLTDTVSLAQRTVELYRAKIATTDGERLYGLLSDVTDTEVIVSDTEKGPLWFRYSGGRIPFTVIKKVVVKRYNKRSGIIQGAVIGGLLTGLVVVRSAQRSPFRSPVLYGVNLTMGVAGGAAAGALAGSSIGNLSRRVIVPRGQSYEERNESLRRQLDPFTYSYQNDILNRVP